MTQEQITAFIGKAKTNRVALIKLKKLAVSLQDFALASELRQMETNLFPESEEEKKAVEEANGMRLIFGMMKVNVSVGTCWLIARTAKVHAEKKGEFSIKDAAEIMAEKDRLFPMEKVNED